MSVLGLIGLGLLGLGAGSLATMGVHRLADPDIGFWRPPPRCPDCHHALARRDLVPLLSWVGCRGRCRFCGGRIDWAYPVVELVTAGLFMMAGWRRPEAVELIPLLILVWALVVASVTDLYVYLIPNRLLFPALASSIVVMIPLALVDGEPERLQQAGVGLALYFMLLFVPHIVYPAGMGMGDVKLALLLGLHLGYAATGMLMTVRMVIIAMLVGSILGVIGGLVVLLARRAGWNVLPDPLESEHRDAETTERDRGSAASFPFGPPLSVGCLMVIGFPAWFGLV